MLEIQLISGLEKILPESRELKAPKFESDIAARGEIYSFQIAMRTDEPGRHIMRIESASKLNLHIRVVKYVPVLYAGPAGDPDVLRNNEPGLYPDLLDEPEFADRVRLVANVWHCLWITVIVGKDQKPGIYPIDISLRDLDTDVVTPCPQFNLEVKDFELLPQTLTNFHWFHTDCLFDYYKVPCWSEEHWQIIENFARNAFAHGINVLYTPLWTPPLDTAVGHARPTCQLIDVELDMKTMHYTFGFAKLRRWIELGKKIGFEKFAMSHIFTQWGAECCPKVIAQLRNTAESTAEACYGPKRPFTRLFGDYPRDLFGWGMESTSAEYRDFLTALFPQLLKVLREYGLGKDNCFFSLSDEPSEEHIETYTKLVNLMTPLLEEFETVEALSNYAFYEKGLVKNPYPSIGHIEDFQGKVKVLNGYYCCGPVANAPNRFIGMPSRRPRMIGILAYVYDLAGFLHWGFNFYNSVHSNWAIDPFATVDADGGFPAGDPFLVYPGKGGDPLDSIRHEVIAAGWQDMRACRTLEAKIGREAVLKLLNEGLERPLRMLDFPASNDFLLNKRRAIYEAIANN